MFRCRSIRVTLRILPRPRGCGRHPHPPGLLRLEERVLLTGGLQDAVSLPIGSWSAGHVGPGGAEFYRIEPVANGLLRVQAQAVTASLQLRLSLYDAGGNRLVQSDGQSFGQPDPLIDEHVAAGVAEIEVQSLSGSGTFALSTSLTPSSAPGQTVPLPPEFQGGSYAPIAVGDFTNNGNLDIIAPDGVHPGTGDGTFGPALAGGALVDPTRGTYPSGIAVGDFNGDGNLDAAVALWATDSVSISMGNRDGTFQPATTIGLPLGGTPDAIVAGDFGTGHTDLAVADSTLNAVYILQGNGDGTFYLAQTVPVGQGPVAIAEGDFAGNGRTDLAVADQFSGDVTVLMNDGDGTFATLPPIAMPAGATPTAIVAGDFGTGHVDLAVVDSAFSVVDILAGSGDGTFRLAGSSTVGADPFTIVAGDFAGDGRTDLAVADANADNVGVLLGNGNGTFQPVVYMAAGSSPLSIVAGDFNRDGRLDLATGNASSNDISVLLGKGDGTFEEPVANLLGYGATAVAAGDFTGNGNLSLAVVNQGSANLTILPGNGDGTFQQPIMVSLPPGSGPYGIVAADFNDDGRTDLAVADPFLNEVDILLGDGDGTFQDLPPIPVAGEPVAIAAGDFTGDGRIDLAVADRASSAVTILLSNGDGTFRVQAPISLGEPNNPPFPVAILAGHFVGGGPLDLAVAEPGADSVAILVGDGDGTFQLAPPVSLGDGTPSVLTMVAGDFTGDGRTSLAVAATDYFNGDSIDILLGNGDGTFNVQPPMLLSFGTYPVGIVAGDFNLDGELDLATADQVGGTDDYSIDLNNGGGTFRPQEFYGLGGPGISTAIAAGDFTGSGRTDLAIARTRPDEVQVALADGGGTFSQASDLAIVPDPTPVVADVNGDGINDILVVGGPGNILYRQGIPGQPGAYNPPITVNTGFPSRDIAWVPATAQGPVLASVDARDNAVSLYAWRDGSFVRIGSLTTGQRPAQIIAADLNGNGWDDLVVRNSGDGTLTVFFNNGLGSFQTGFLSFSPVTRSVGLGVSDVQAIDTTRDGYLDLVVTNKLTGLVGLLRNRGDRSFTPAADYLAGSSAYEIDPTGSPEVTNLDETAGVAAGVLTADGPTDLITLNPGSNSVGVLAGLGGGRFANPQALPTEGSPEAVCVADFNGDGISDMALLSRVGLSIDLGDGKGGFLPPTTYAVPSGANGLTVADLTGNGRLDLLVGDSSGDILILMGNGNGTFEPYREANQVVALAVADLTGNGSKDIIYADQGLDRVVVDYAAGHSSVVADQATGLLQPGAVALADLNGDGIPDLIVANSGSNNVLIYPGLGNGQFGPAINDGNGYFVGTNPVGITVADLTGSLPDLVIADKGSNQVSILINRSQKGGTIAFRPGPRLNPGGSGPVSTVVGQFTGGPFPDLLVTNSGSGNVTLLPGVGRGFFNDQFPRAYAVGTNPVATFAGNFSGPTDLVTVNAGSNTLTIISGFAGSNPVVSTIPSGGLAPTTAFAFSTGNGYQDLVVGNSGDGALALFEGGPEGLSLVSVESEPNLPAPTALAFSALTGETVEFYAATAGREAAALISLSLSPPPDLGTGLGVPPPTPSVQLVAVNDTSLPLVATVLTLTIPGSGDEFGPSLAGAEATGVAATVTGSATSVGQGPFTASRPGATRSGGDQDPAETGEGVAAAPSTLSPWERLVLGVDEAIEELGRDGESALVEPPAPPERANLPSAPGLPTPGPGPGLRSVPDRPSENGSDGPDRASTDGGWPAHVRVGTDTGAVRPSAAAHADVGISPAESGPGGARASGSPPRADGHRVRPACVAAMLLAARWGALRLSGRPTAAAARPESPTGRRCPPGLI